MRLEYFQMLDQIVALDAGERTIRSTCTVPKESPIFEGHFPGYPLMPGVLLTECMAQTTGWLVSALNGFSAMPFLAGIKEAKFRVPVLPGDVLEFDGKVIHEGSGYSVAECRGSRDTAAICSAQLVFRILPYPNPQFRQTLCAWAEQLDLPVKELMK